jgi:hypothetical protein
VVEETKISGTLVIVKVISNRAARTMFFICALTHYMQLVTSSNDMMLIKLFAFFLLFKNSEAFARSSLDNISFALTTPHFRHHSIPSSTDYYPRPQGTFWVV